MDTVRNEKGKYLVVVEGSIPVKDGGIYCTIGGRTALDIAREVCSNAAATITVGACAFYGGWPSARPNPTGAVGVQEAVPGITVINLPGCPPNAVNITATIVHFLTFGALPATDQHGAAALRLRRSGSTTSASGAPTSTPASSWRSGATRGPQGLVPLQDGLQGPGDLPQLPDRPVERRDELADRCRARLHRLHRAGLLGHR